MFLLPFLCHSGFELATAFLFFCHASICFMIDDSKYPSPTFSDLIDLNLCSTSTCGLITCVVLVCYRFRCFVSFLTKIVRYVFSRHDLCSSNSVMGVFSHCSCPCLWRSVGWLWLFPELIWCFLPFRGLFYARNHPQHTSTHEVCIDRCTNSKEKGTLVISARVRYLSSRHVAS